MLRLAHAWSPASPADGDGANPNKEEARGPVGRPGSHRSALLRDVLFLVLLAGSVLLLGNFAVVRTIMQPRAHLIGLGVAAEVGAIHDAVTRLPPAQRLPWIRQLVRESRGSLVLASSGPGIMRPPANSIQADTLKVIQQRLPHMVIGLVDGDPPDLWFAMPGDGGELIWLKFPTAHVADRTGMLVAAWGSGGVLVVLGSLAAIGWRQQLRVRRAGADLARLEAASAHGSDANDPVTTAFPHSAPVDLPAVDSLEDVVRMMSVRMADIDKQRDEALEAAARQLAGVVEEVPDAATGAPSLSAMGRIAGEFQVFARRQRLAQEPARQVDLNALVERATVQAPFGVMLGLAPVPPLTLRPAAVEHLLDNLLRNALTHGGGQAVLTTGEEGDWVVLRVMDRGEALSDEELAMVGRPFYRSEAARANGPGSGLGLALARHVAQMHGGELRVARRDGGGLVVELRLPVPKEESPGASGPPPRRSHWPAWTGLVGDVTLLAVLYVGALALGLSLLAHTVMQPNVQASTRLWTNLIGMISATYEALPANARPAFLQDLERHSGGAVHEADPAGFTIAEPLLEGARTALQGIRSARPDLEITTSPIPDPAMWVRMPAVAGQPAGPWLRLDAPHYSSDLVAVFLGLMLLVAASAAFLAVRARRRLDWAAQSLGHGQAQFQAEARAHGESQAMVDSLGAVRERFERVCRHLSQAKYEQEVLLARLLQDLRVTIGGLGNDGSPLQPIPAGADRLAGALHVLEQLAHAAGESGTRLAQVTELLCELQAGAAHAGGPAIRVSPGAVPPAALESDEARRLLSAILHYLLEQHLQSLALSSAFHNGWVVVRFTGNGGRSDAGAAAQALQATCRTAESHGGFMRFGQVPGGGGVEVDLLLPPAFRT